MSKRYPHWVVRWNENKTTGLVWRIRDWGGRPRAPVVEGTMRRPKADPCMACGVTVDGHPTGDVFHDSDCPIRITENMLLGLYG